MKFYSKKNEKTSPYAKISFDKISAEKKGKPEAKCEKRVFENDGRIRGKK